MCWPSLLKLPSYIHTLDMIVQQSIKPTFTSLIDDRCFVVCKLFLICNLHYDIEAAEKLKEEPHH